MRVGERYVDRNNVSILMLKARIEKQQHNRSNAIPPVPDPCLHYLVKPLNHTPPQLVTKLRATRQSPRYVYLTTIMIDLGLKRIAQLVTPSALPWKAIHVRLLSVPYFPH
jgi:hypothetical protein